ncbi:hypothetical protein JHW43_003425 [Diplocarpon mali]|nr:hypothetical protein JHW43_003425 [Diplocarpon mali]
MADAAVPFSHEASETVVVVVVVVVVAVAVTVVVVMAGVVVEAETVNQSRGSDLLSRKQVAACQAAAEGGSGSGSSAPAHGPASATGIIRAWLGRQTSSIRHGGPVVPRRPQPPPYWDGSEGAPAPASPTAGLGVEPEIPEPWQALADPLRDGDTTLGPIETGAWPALLPCPGPPSSPLASQRRPSSHLDTGGPLHDWGSSPRPPLVAGPRNSLPPSDATANASPDERLASSAHSAARTGETPARRHGTRHG